VPTLDETRPGRPDAGVWVVAAFYQLLALLILPLVLVRFLLLSRKSPAYRTGFAARLGHAPRGLSGGAWIFAASLGELRAVSPLVRELRARGVTVRLTQNTAEGLREAHRLFGQDTGILVHYAPLDLMPFVWLFLKRARPAVGIVVESELWPGYLLTAWLLGVPMVQVNGNLLDRSIDRDRRILGGVRLKLLRLYTLVTTKTDEYVGRYLRAGVDEARVHRVGELKFDQETNPNHVEMGAAARRSWAGDAPVFLIASSIDIEEDQLSEVVASLLDADPVLRIVWAPRSPQTFDAVAERLGTRAARRSVVLDDTLQGEIPSGARVLLADAIGEMSFNYELSDLVFVGASLVDRGGHTPVEPLSVGRPVLMGSSIFGVIYPTLEAQAAGALRIVQDAGELRETAADLLSTPAELDAMRAKARAFAADHVGAAARTMTLLKEFF